MRVSTLTAVLVALPAALGLGSAGSAPGAAAQTPAAPPETARPERQCFSPQQVQNFRTAGADTVYLKVGANTVI